jgi:hypothetical protein
MAMGFSSFQKDNSHFVHKSDGMSYSLDSIGQVEHGQERNNRHMEHTGRHATISVPSAEAPVICKA